MENPSPIQAAIRAAVDRGEKAMGIFLTNGFPHPDETLSVLRAIDRAGADFIELGMPFSDPIAEGGPIQRASAQALAHGTRMSDAFAVARTFCAESSTPVLLMGYINPVLRYGVEAFCKDASEAGVCGLILPDLPPEEAHLIAETAARYRLGLVLLIAPTTPKERIERIDTIAHGAFIYAVSITGLTGSGLGEVDAVTTYLREARSVIHHNPLLVGFGIRSHEDGRRLSAETDGFIVGSALVTEIEALWDKEMSADARIKHVESFVHALKFGESTT